MKSSREKQESLKQNGLQSFVRTNCCIFETIKAQDTHESRVCKLASDLFSILLNFNVSFLFCNVHMSLQRSLPTTALPHIGSSVSSAFLLEELEDLLLEVFRANRVHRRPLLFLEGLLTW